MRMRNRVAVMHGVNLDMLERRPPELYGDLSLPEARGDAVGAAHHASFRRVSAVR